MRLFLALHAIGALVLMTVASPAMANHKGHVAFGIHAGTLGYGPDIYVPISPRLTLRGTGNFFDLEYDETVDGIDYDLDLDLMTAGAVLDLHPFATGFHISFGAFYNDNSAGLGATANQGSSIGSFTVPAGQTVGLRGDLEVDEFSPYIGLGWDSTYMGNSPWSIYLQLGVLFQNDISVALSQTSGPAVSQSDLDAEARSVEDDLDLLEFYPVLSIGLSYSF